MSDRRHAAHPTFRKLLDLADGALSPRRAETVQTHLDTGCRSCEEELSSIAELRTVLAAGPLPAPPATVLRRAARLYPKAQWASLFDRAAHLVASLVLDQRTALAPALRAGGGSRQLLWTFGDYELIATLSLRRDGMRLRGQVLSPEHDAGKLTGEIRIHGAGQASVACSFDENGEFVIDGLRPGTHVGHGQIDGQEFSLPPFVID